MILGIDTSLGTAVAVIDPDGVVRAEASSSDPRGHAEVIGDLLRETLAAASAPGEAAAPGEPASITHVAAGMGPGPFTGLRVGIAAARAFALGRGIPVVPVVSHDAVALAVLLRDAIADVETPRFAVVTDARRREFAFSVYEALDDDGLPTRSHGPALVPRDELDTRLAALGADRLDAAAIPPALLALAAARALAADRRIAPDDALYLRSPDVTLPAGPKRVTA